MYSCPNGALWKRLFELNSKTLNIYFVLLHSITLFLVCHVVDETDTSLIY